MHGATAPAQEGPSLGHYKRRCKTERLFAWLGNFLRLVVHYESCAVNYSASSIWGTSSSHSVKIHKMTAHEVNRNEPAMQPDEATEAPAHALHATISRRPILPALIAVTPLTVILLSVFFANRGSAGPSHPSTTTSRGGPPPWMRVEPSLAGTWLHWREYEYNYDSTSPDPAIGKLLMADIWEHIGTNNVPTLFHDRITFAANGQFYQEVYDSPTASITVQGTAYESVYPTEVSLPETWCVEHWPVDPGRLPKLTPEFADEHGVQTAGFSLTTRGPLHAPPATPAAHFAAEHVFAVPPQLHQWDQRQTFSQGYVGATTLQVDARGRVVYEEWSTVDPQGKTVMDTWFSRGDLYVYPENAAIPAASTSPPRAPQGGC